MRIDQRGVTRIVFLTKDYAIKFPRVKHGWSMFIQGVYSNLSEASCWKITESPSLCPVLFSFMGFILVMPKLKICLEDTEIPEQEDPGEDRHACNYGYYQDRVVCVDYPYHRIKPYKR